MLDQETQLLQLTDTVQNSQKKEDELRKKLSAFDELEMQHESKVNDMYQQLKQKDDQIQSAEQLNRSLSHM